jgi:hypothetical protein
MAAQRIEDPGQKPGPSHSYRYRTKALVGPWRETRARATADALYAGQIRRDEGDRRKLVWLVEGRIEKRDPEPPIAVRVRRAAAAPGV